MSFAIYLDEHVSPLLATLLRQLGHDVLTTIEAGNRGLPDEQQIEFAASHDRAIFTYDQGDYQKLAIAWSQSSKRHAGIVIATRTSPYELRHRFLLLFEQHPDGITDLVVGLPRLT